MGQKRGRTEGSFVRETRAQAVTFYRDLVQNLKPWQVRPPQIPSEGDTPKSVTSSPPDALPLMPDEVNKAGVRNDDMSDFSAPADPPHAPIERGNVTPTSVGSPADDIEPTNESSATAR
jgi:hypothetical protein